MVYTVFRRIPYKNREVHKEMKKIPTFALGLIVGATLTAGTVVGASNSLSAIQKTVKLVVDGKSTSVSAVNVNNKLYIPVRDAGNSFGYSVTGVTSSAVTFSEGTTSTTASVSTGTSTSTTATTGGEYVEGLHDKYSTDGKLDANKIKVGLAAGEITVNAQEESNGTSLLQYAIKENNFEVYSLIKVNSLNVNLQDNSGNTALHTAVICDSIFYVGELKTLKVDATIKNKDGKQAIDYATKNSSIQINLEAYML
ncbi:hypothetical protein D3C75_654460 [compost metagenome]